MELHPYTAEVMEITANKGFVSASSALFPYGTCVMFSHSTSRVSYTNHVAETELAECVNVFNLQGRTSFSALFELILSGEEKEFAAPHLPTILT